MACRARSLTASKPLAPGVSRYSRRARRLAGARMATRRPGRAPRRAAGPGRAARHGAELASGGVWTECLVAQLVQGLLAGGGGLLVTHERAAPGAADDHQHGGGLVAEAQDGERSATPCRMQADG